MRIVRTTIAASALAASCLVAAGGAGPTTASGPDRAGEIAVYPSGDPALDIARVQAAVDSAENVLLKASDGLTGAPAVFDFGDNTPGGGFVVLSQDVAIRGETIGAHRTTIAGGFAPLRGVAWNPVTSSISGIDFDAPGVAALFVTGATGVEFVGNHVEHVVGLPDWLPGLSKGQGVWIVGPSTVTGHIRIADNVIEDVDAHNGYGLALFGFAADAQIENNTVRDVDTAGILVGNHTGHVVVNDNHIQPGTARYQTDYGHGSGIIVGNAYGGSSYVGENTVDCVNPWALGIFVAASSTLYGDIQDDAVIERNRVRVDGPLSGGIALLGSVANTRVRNNIVTGAGEFALGGLVWITPADVVVHNRFAGNNISRFDSLVADVLFDVNTSQNVVQGRAELVVDQGVDNWISGTSTGPPPIAAGPASFDRSRSWGDVGPLEARR